MLNLFSSSKTANETPSDSHVALSNDHSGTHKGPISNVTEAINPTTGTGSHLPPSEHSNNPLSSRHDDTHGGNPLSSTKNALNPNTGSGAHFGGARTADQSHGLNASAPGRDHESYNHGHPGGNIASAVNPTTGTGSHLPPADHSTNPLSSKHDDTHGGNALSSTKDALNSRTGTGAHVGEARASDRSHEANALHSATKDKDHDHSPLTSNKHTERTDRSTVAGSGVPGAGTGSHLPSSDHSKKDALNPTTGQGTHVGSTRPDDHVKTTETEKARLQADKDKHAGSAAPGEPGHPAPAAHKPSITQKVKGTVETLVGKVTHNETKVAEGTALKTTGETHPAPSTY